MATFWNSRSVAEFSVIASCGLHRIEPYDNLADVLRLLPYWPAERLIERAPKYWAGTRARLDPKELADQIGVITVPPSAET